MAEKHFPPARPRLDGSWMTSCPVRPAAPPDSWPFPRSTYAGGSPGPPPGSPGGSPRDRQGRGGHLGHMAFTAAERRLWAAYLQTRK